MTTIQEYLERTKQAEQAISLYQDVLRKARTIRARAQQEVEHRYQEEMQEGL